MGSPPLAPQGSGVEVELSAQTLTPCPKMKLANCAELCVNSAGHLLLDEQVNALGDQCAPAPTANYHHAAHTHVRKMSCRPCMTQSRWRTATTSSRSSCPKLRISCPVCFVFAASSRGCSLVVRYACACLAKVDGRWPHVRGHAQVSSLAVITWRRCTRRSSDSSTRGASRTHQSSRQCTHPNSRKSKEVS